MKSEELRARIRTVPEHRRPEIAVVIQESQVVRECQAALQYEPDTAAGEWNKGRGTKPDTTGFASAKANQNPGERQKRSFQNRDR